jgi:hypothetical protein
VTTDHEDDRDPDPDDANDNGASAGKARAVVLAPAHGALKSLAELKSELNKVDRSFIVRRSFLPMLQFKSREGGIWQYGQRNISVEEGSQWAVSPTTFEWGYICFSDANKRLGEELVPVSQPKPDVTQLPDYGFPWQEQKSVELKCLGGADKDLEVVYKPTTEGGLPVITDLFEAVLNRINSDEHDNKVAPIVLLEKDSYQHPKHGRIWIPVMTLVGWMPREGPASAPKDPAPQAPSSASEPQRRRRRVA